MIKLRAIFRPAPDQDFSEMAHLTREMIAANMEQMAEAIGTHQSVNLSAAYAQDEMGEEYHELRVQAVGMVTIKGERWALTSGVLMLSFDSLLETVDEAFKLYEASRAESLEG